MSSFPVRCDYCRLHRDPETVCECHERMQEHVRAATSQAVQVGDTETRRSRPKNRRGRKSLPSSSPFSDPDIETSPLARFSTTVEAAQRRSQSGPPRTPPREKLLPEQLNSDSEADIRDNIVVASGRRNSMAATSPASTQVVEETPLWQLNGQQRFRNSVDDTPTPASRRAPAKAQEEVDPGAESVHYATHPDQATEIARLRKSRNVLVQALEASTANLNRLQTRILATGGDRSALAEEPQQAKLDRERALTAVAGVNKFSGRVLTDLLVFLLVTMVFFLVWVWVNGPDYEYIQKRRTQVLCE
ncbi:hypothetical protein BST61_g8687 [Cercospora zeina]